MSRFFDELEDRLRASAAELHGEAGGQRRRRRRPPRRLLAVAILAGIAGAAVPAISAVTDVWRPDLPPAPAPTTPGDGHVVAGDAISCRGTTTPALDVGPAVGPEFAEVLGVLARPRTAADRIRPIYLRSLGLVDVDVAGVRRVGVAADGKPFYVIPARGHGYRPWPRRCLRGLTARQRRRVTAAPVVEPTICTMSGGGGGCGPLRHLARYGTYGTGGTVRGRSTVTGLAPNGVREVRVTYGRSTRTFPVRDNLFSFLLGVDAMRAAPDRLEWLMDDGSVRDVTR